MKLLFIDTDTGGLNPDVNSLLRVIFAVLEDDGDVKETLAIPIKQDNYNVTAESLYINGINLRNDIHKYGLTPSETIMRIISFVKRNFGEEPPILVGHNISLDKYMLRNLFKLNGVDMDKLFGYRMIDTMSLLWACHLIGKIPFSACSSEGAYDYFKINSIQYSKIEKKIKLYQHLIQVIGRC